MKTAIKIITLNPQASLAKNLLNDIKEQGLSVDFFTAVDGRDGMPTLLDGESIDMNKSLAYRMTKLGGAEIGAYLSHYRCIKKAYEDGVDRICVLEDDVGIEKSFNEAIKKIYALPEKYELVRLMDLKRCKRKLLGHITSQHRLTRPEKGTLGAQGYVINKQGMKKIINLGMPIWKPIDKLIDHYWEIDLRLFSIEPHVIWEKPSETTIKKTSYNNKKDIKWLFWHLKKLKRSFNRKLYLIKNYSEFHPKNKPPIKMGKTLRKG